ncbi:hypothetical protein FX988_03476 [Paraglaciecola mesophila]|uniref:Uncharacterized protein n=2 Tax=Paraglaciecola mesophila TaxID=197222 RepID=A0A857JMC1_9ALTE|nr:hypothetical protein FX988_03476 [Paraglaciecola mesophila]
MVVRHFLSRVLLGRRLTTVEQIEQQAYANQQMILARKEQIISANKEFCRQPATPIAAFATGAAAGMLNNKKPASLPLVMRIVGMTGLL